MFDVGDLVRFKNKGITKSRYNPDKKIGIVISVRRNVFMSYESHMEYRIWVPWMHWDKEG